MAKAENNKPQQSWSEFGDWGQQDDWGQSVGPYGFDDACLSLLAETANTNTPTLKKVITENWPLPDGAVFLGLDEDGLPVLLEPNDASPGPILIAGDDHAANTNYLEMIAKAAKLAKNSSDRHAVLTNNNSKKWQNCVKDSRLIYQLGTEAAEKLIPALAHWAYHNPTSPQKTILLVDDLDLFMSNTGDEAYNSLNWLLDYGPARGVWPIASFNTSDLKGKTAKILPKFGTRMLGSIQNAELVDAFGADKGVLDSLHPGSQFALQQGNKLTRVWVPTTN